METLNENEVDKQFEMFEKTFSNSEEDQQKAKELIRFVARQMNDRTLRGYVDFEFDTIIRNSAKGLFYITYLQQMKYPEDNTTEEQKAVYSKDKEIIVAKTICKSSFNMLYLLATRVHKGRDYDLIGREIDSRKPLMVSQK
jgi:hypothetical protein